MDVRSLNQKIVHGQYKKMEPFSELMLLILHFSPTLPLLKLNLSEQL